MKSLYFITLVAIFSYGCSTSRDNLKQIVTNTTLRNCLNQIINHEDSLQKVIPTYGNNLSFTVTFSEEDDRCFVELVADINIYDSHAMDGYFMYKEKYISIYGLSSKCGDSFLNKKKLKHGLILGLYDFNEKAFELAIKEHKPPPSPPPPGEPFYRKYLILSPETFIKVKDYDDDVKNFQQNRYLK